MVVSFCAVSFPGLQVLRDTRLIVACCTTSWPPITLTLAPTAGPRLPADRVAAANDAASKAGRSVEPRLSAGRPDMAKGGRNRLALLTVAVAPSPGVRAAR